MENRKRRMANQKFNSGGFSKPRTAQPQPPQQGRLQPSPSKAPVLTQRLVNPGFRNTSPEGQFQKNALTTSTVGVTCFYCNEVGHYTNKCPKKQQPAIPTWPNQGILALAAL